MALLFSLVNVTPTISIGDLIEVAVFLVTMFTLHNKNAKRIGAWEERQSIIWGYVKEQLGIKTEDK